MPVGGVKQKVLAAHRAGLHTVIIPKRNEPDLDDLPEEVRQSMTFVPVETIDEALPHVLPGLQRSIQLVVPEAAPVVTQNGHVKEKIARPE